MSPEATHGVTINSTTTTEIAVVALDAKQVYKFNTAGVGTVFADFFGGVLSPTGMAVDTSGNLYVANYLADSIAKITPAGVGSLFADITDGVNHPFDVAVGTVVGGMSAPSEGGKSGGGQGAVFNTLVGLSRLATGQATAASDASAASASAATGGIVAAGSASNDAPAAPVGRAGIIAAAARRRAGVADAVDEAFRDAGLDDAADQLAQLLHGRRGRR